jgi:propionyl-CoA synthetase
MLSNSFAHLIPKPGAAGSPLPGMDVRIVDDEGKEVAQGEMGNVVLARPLPPTALVGVWGDEKKFEE